MKILILNEYLYSKPKWWSAVQTVNLPDGRFMLPKDVLTEPSLQDAVDEINAKTEMESDILDLPEIGEPVKMNVVYKLPVDLTSMELSNLVVCVQDHD